MATSRVTSKELYARKQIAIRKLLLDEKGGIRRDARPLIADFRRFCQAGPKATLVKYSPDRGGIDPIATVVAATRREIWDRYFSMLMIDPQEIADTREDD